MKVIREALKRTKYIQIKLKMEKTFLGISKFVSVPYMLIEPTHCKEYWELLFYVFGLQNQVYIEVEISKTMNFRSKAADFV